MSDQLKRTPFFEQHLEHGAKMVPFAGFEMPIQYEGIKAEHTAVRTAAGLFDVSHMGEFFVSGPQALSFLQKITVNDVSKLAIGKAQYSCMCYENGGIVDDLIVYRLAEDDYLMVVNGANITKDWEWVQQNNTEGAQLTNASDDYALLALQGPASTAILTGLTEVALDEIPFYGFKMGTVAGMPAIISATGYTGEKGFELYINAKDYPVGELFDQLLAAGDPHVLKLCGLGARDTLRLEKGYALYGNDITAETHPLEARLGWITKLDKGFFIGSETLSQIKEKGVDRKLMGFTIEEARAIPRKDYRLFDEDAHEVGYVTSGGMSITLEKGIGMAYVDVEAIEKNKNLVIQIRNKEVPIQLCTPPFV